MKKIKVLFVIDNIFHVGGGTEGQLSKLINSLDRSEFEVHLAALRHSSWIETDYFDCPKFVVGIRSFKNPDALRKVRQLSGLIREKRFDIVETFFPDSNLAGVIAARLGRAGRIVSAQRNLGHDLNRGRILALKCVSRFVDRYLANCEAVKESLVSKLGVSGEKVDVIYNGIDCERFEKAGGESVNGLRRKLGIEDEVPIVGLVSNFRSVKNIDGFLRAAADVLANFSRITFLIIGEGKAEENQRLKRLSNDLGLAERIVWAGTVDDVAPYLQLLDVGVLSSFSEGLSNTVLEYMAAGLPVVATEVGGNSELISEPGGGFLVPPNDSAALAKRILILLSNPELRVEMGKTNQGIARSRFSLAQMIDNHQKYFSELLVQR